MVTWLTLDYGKITTLIKGSQRPKSAFIGQYDLFYTCELVFYSRQPHRLPIAKECMPLKPRAQFRHKWKASAIASYMTDLISRIIIPDTPTSELFRFMDAGLDQAEEYGVSDSFVFWFELKLFTLLGLAPRLQHCLTCNEPFAPGIAHTQFAYAQGGIFCKKCTSKNPQGLPLTPDVLATLIAWQRAQSPQITRRKVRPQQRDVINQVLRLFLAYHLDMSLTRRDITLNTINYL